MQGNMAEERIRYYQVKIESGVENMVSLSDYWHCRELRNFYMEQLFEFIFFCENTCADSELRPGDALDLIRQRSHEFKEILCKPRTKTEQ